MRVIIFCKNGNVQLFNVRIIYKERHYNTKNGIFLVALLYLCVFKCTIFSNYLIPFLLNKIGKQDTKNTVN